MKHFTFFIALSIICSMTLPAQWKRLNIDEQKQLRTENVFERKGVNQNTQNQPSISNSEHGRIPSAKAAGTTIWSSSNDEVCAIAWDSHSSGIYVTGSSESGFTRSDFLTIKYSSEGDVLWSARYDGPSSHNEYARAMAIDRDGNVYVTGESYSIGTDFDYATIKYNSSGIEQWVARYNGPENSDDKAADMAIDFENNIYVTGCSKGTGTDYDYVTIKYNSDGVEQWAMRYNGPGDSADIATKVRLDRFGNVYITGYSYDPMTDFDYATIKYSSLGVFQWVSRFDRRGNNPELSPIMAVDSSSNSYVAGEDYYVKYNSDGVEIWRHLGPEHANDMSIDAFNNIYVCASSKIMKYDSLGGIIWQYNTSPGMDGYSGVNAIAVDGRGNIYATGSIFSWCCLYHDYATYKYDIGGNLKWMMTYSSGVTPYTGFDFARDIIVDSMVKYMLRGIPWRSGRVILGVKLIILQ